MQKFLNLSVAFILAFFILAASGQALLVFMDNNVYAIGKDMTFKVNRTANVNITGVIINSTGDNHGNFTIVNGTPGIVEYEYSQSLPVDEYTVTVTEVSDSVNLDFKIVSEILRPEIRLMGSDTAIVLDTTPIDAWNAEGGNYSELLALNKSDSIYYGEANLTGGSSNISFVVVDEKKDNSTQQTYYDSVYVDDDKIFQLYNDAEDSGQDMIETSKRPGDLLDFGSGNEYIISDVEVPTGKKIFLIKPVKNPHFSSGYTVNFTLLVRNSSGYILPDVTLNVTVSHVSKKAMWSTIVNTGSDGYANTSFPVDGSYTPGKYLILANGTPAEVFKIESFKLFGKVTDLSNNPASSFAPDTKAKIWAVGKDNADNFITLSPITGILQKPDGSTDELTFAEADTGIYSAETSDLTQTGEYKVVISGTNGGNTEEFVMGFSVESLKMMLMAVNPKYIEESVEMAAFPPGGSNISVLVFMINTTAGSMMKEGGPPCMGDSCVTVDCGDFSQFTVVVRDEEGNRFKLNGSDAYANPDFQTPTFSSMTVNDAAQNVFIIPPPPEPEMLEQCMLILWPGNYTYSYKEGNYKVEVTFYNKTIGEFRAGATYDVQRLYASASTVDFKGDNFVFLSPNSTVRIKLEIRDMENDELLNASEILDIKITEMWKEWPDRKDAFDIGGGYTREIANASVNGNFLQFTSPPEEGFYMAKFRFRADRFGQIHEGTGDLFFDLKKYMIWAELAGMEQGMWYVKPDDNITLQVNAMDIDMGKMFDDKDFSRTCTGCTGLVATVGAVRNEQFFKEMEEGVDYTVIEGMIINETAPARVVIDPVGDLPSGWYGIDIILNDTENDVQYYGWGWFEIRNFWTDIMFVEKINGSDPEIDPELAKFDGNYTEANNVFAAGGNILVAVAAFEPPQPDMPPEKLDVTQVDIENIQDDRTWPPLIVPSNKYTMVGTVDADVLLGGPTDGPGPSPLVTMTILNISLADDIKESNYMLNLRVEVSGGEQDVGTEFFTVASYELKSKIIPESKTYDWPPLYSTAENLTLMFEAHEFNGSDRDIKNITVKGMFSREMDRPIKMKYGDNYTNDCTGNKNNCTVYVNLSYLQDGEYMIDLEVVDSQDSEQTMGIEFMIKNLVFSTPQIHEAWAFEQLTPDRSLDAWESEDRCDNEVDWSSVDCGSKEGHPYYEFDNSSNVVHIHLDSEPDWTFLNITIPDNKNELQDYQAWIFCVVPEEGFWYTPGSQNDCMQGPGHENDVRVYVVGNTTVAWINVSDVTVSASGYKVDISDSVTLYNDSALGPTTFSLEGLEDFTWELAELGDMNNPNYLNIKHAGGIICGRNESGQVIKIVAPAGHENYTDFYYAQNYLVGGPWEGGGLAEELGMEDQPVFVYHNTTHLWLVPSDESPINFTNASIANGPAGPGQTINDGHGGKWKVVSLSKSRIELRGENVLERGILVNTSLSSSGVFRLGLIEEERMGFEDKFKEENQGMDLDNDGETNGSLYFLITDSADRYDTLIFSDSGQPYNFTNESRKVMISQPRSQRQVGLNDKLTLLNIDPRANQVMFYSEASGNWPELGDNRIGDNVTIPIVVRSPDGSLTSANVSVVGIKVKTVTGKYIDQVSLQPVEITGIGEIQVNLSAISPSYKAGQYEFGLKVVKDGKEEILNEWNWPRTRIRNFLVDNWVGYGGILSDFASMTIDSYGGGWGNTVMVRDLFTINQSEQGHAPIAGAMAHVRNELLQAQCPQFDVPDDITPIINKTYIIDEFGGQYYGYMAPVQHPDKIWLKQGDCNFSEAKNYTAGDPVNITLGTDTFMLYVLNSTKNFGAIGLSNFPDTVKPLRMDTYGPNQAPRWNIMSINRSGTLYNIVFANDTMPYPQAGTWGVQEVSKIVWIDTDGNFSDAESYSIGENISGELYVSRVGPGPWEGISLGDSTNLSSFNLAGRPGMYIRPQDDTPVYFGVADESDAGLDLDMDDDNVDEFYMVTFDDFGDGQQELTRIYVDDDINMTEPWWANSSNPEEGDQYYDFYGNEYGIRETDGSVPTGMWSGHVMFGEFNDSLPYEERPEWEIMSYNGTSLLLMKNVWGIQNDKPVTLMTRAYDFSQQPISGADVTVDKVVSFGFFFKPLQLGLDYNVTNVQNVTDDKGYAVIKLENGNGWDDGEYVAYLKVVKGSETELVEVWFRVGEAQWEW